jgi:hypothetical protein
LWKLKTYLYGKYSLNHEYVHVKVKEPERGLVINEFDIPSGKFSKLVQTNVCSQNLGTQYILYILNKCL